MKVNLDNIKVIVSCSTKFWAFNLAEELEKYGCLHEFYTTYSSVKNPFFKRFAKRIDSEKITPKKIHTNIILAIGLKLIKNPFLWNNIFDRWVARKIKKSNADIFIGWSGMSLHSLRAAKKKGMKTILERGSAHIQYQNEILQEEYQSYNIRFSINPKVITKEISEYSEADYIALPSKFSFNSFVDKGINPEKLIINNYGSSSQFFKPSNTGDKQKFIIMYFGALMIRKGLKYLFRAIKDLDIPQDKFEVWFVGGIKDELKDHIEKESEKNWVFTGHVQHKNLSNILSKASIAVVPSIEDGFGMVVPQLFSCNIPVIVSENTGSMDLVEEGKNGFVVPIRNAQAIKNKIQFIYNEPKKLIEMKRYIKDNPVDLSWDAYGNRYVEFLKSIT